jgi:hypothetical protein
MLNTEEQVKKQNYHVTVLKERKCTGGSSNIKKKKIVIEACNEYTS